MTLTKAQAQFIAEVGPEGLPVDRTTEAQAAIARDLIKSGAMFDWWKGLVVSRYTPTKAALASAAAYLFSVDGAGI